MARERPAPETDSTVPPTARRARRPIDGKKVLPRFIGVVTRVPAYMKLGWRLLREPRIPTRGKAALAGALGYAISPIDPLPGFIPVIGQLDDLGILLLGLRSTLRGAPDDVSAEHLAATGLTFEALDRDLATVRVTAIWVAERTGALASRAAKAAVGAVLSRINRVAGDRGADGALSVPSVVESVEADDEAVPTPRKRRQRSP